MECGYLYVATGEKYLREVEISARSLRRFTKLPVALVTDKADYKSDLFDVIISETALYPGYGTKIPGMVRSPFKEKTIFLDTDTFIADSLDVVFDLLDVYQFAMTMELTRHSDYFIFMAQPEFKVKFRDVLPEFNTGVIGYRNGDPKVMEFLRFWDEYHRHIGFRSDMPSFREAYIQKPVTVGVLPQEFNFFGTGTFAIAYHKIRVLHERLGQKWNDRRSFMLGFEKMDKYLNKLNKVTYKRLIVPFVGVVPSNYSPISIRNRIKKMLGIKLSSKMNAGKKKLTV